MGQGAALGALLNAMRFLHYAMLTTAIVVAPWAVRTVHACACCINNTTYSAGTGADSYKIDEIRKLTSTWHTTLGAGVGESGISMAEPKTTVQQDVGHKTLAWRITLSERNTVTGKTQKVVFRFTPESAKKWFYITRTEPLSPKRELSGMAHDFLMYGTVAVLSDPDKVMKDVRFTSAQLVLYAKGNQCFSSQDFYAFMLDLSLMGKDNAGGQLTGEGRIP
jgi:hypothetical protein